MISKWRCSRFSKSKPSDLSESSLDLKIHTVSMHLCKTCILSSMSAPKKAYPQYALCNFLNLKNSRNAKFTICKSCAIEVVMEQMSHVMALLSIKLLYRTARGAVFVFRSLNF